jgi:Retinal pigment epithelial membrane protein
VQHALLADGTAFDVDAGDAKQEVADGLRPRSRRRRLSQEHVARRQSGRPAAVGEQPEVADADEAVGDPVEQEAAQKLVDDDAATLGLLAVSGQGKAEQPEEQFDQTACWMVATVTERSPPRPESSHGDATFLPTPMASSAPQFTSRRAVQARSNISLSSASSVCGRRTLLHPPTDHAAGDSVEPDQAASGSSEAPRKLGRVHPRPSGPVLRARTIHDFGPGRAPSESVFVPASATAAEDEGWLLTYVYDAARDTSALVMLDAKDFTGKPVAAIALPQRVPFGFHGSWLPEPA